MFSDSKYTRWYYSIIEKSTKQHRKKYTGTYFEKHHIIPRSLGGNNSKKNLVLLTAKEHYICHLLLVHMTTGKTQMKMYHAFVKMSSNPTPHQRFSSRLFSFHREKLSYVTSNERHPRYGSVWSPEKRNLISTRTKAAMATDEVRQNFIDGIAKRNYTHSDDMKEYMRKTRKGKLWISNPTTKETKMVVGPEYDILINSGWVKGRLFNNPFVNSGTNFRNHR